MAGEEIAKESKEGLQASGRDAGEGKQQRADPPRPSRAESRLTPLSKHAREEGEHLWDVELDVLEVEVDVVVLLLWIRNEKTRGSAAAVACEGHGE